VIVVLDSHIGGIRQSGDHSGYCVSMNAWTADAEGAPVKLSKHAAELDAEAENSSTAAANETVSTH
jgi:hypothetical protein